VGEFMDSPAKNSQSEKSVSLMTIQHAEFFGIKKEI